MKNKSKCPKCYHEFDVEFNQLEYILKETRKILNKTDEEIEKVWEFLNEK
jgi:hypothetical protein